MVNIASRGTVIPPEAKTKVDLGAKPFEVNIQAPTGHDKDDCIFIRTIYPDGMAKNHQLFKTDKPERLLEKIMQTFESQYGVKVMPVEPLRSFEPQIIKFKE